MNNRLKTQSKIIWCFIQFFYDFGSILDLLGEPWGAQEVHNEPDFAVLNGPGNPNGSQASPKSPQGQSKPRFPSIFGWFWMIFWWFSVSDGLLFIWFAPLLFWFPRAFIFKFLATSSNVLGSSAGVSKVTKKCDVAHLLSSLPLCFCYLEPYFSSFWP